MGGSRFILIIISVIGLLFSGKVLSFQVASNDSADITIGEREEKITYYDGVEQKILISELQIQIEATQAVNDLYNFKFERAERQFRWLEQKYEWHPLPYFLMGLSEWWKIMPELENPVHDEKFHFYMDKSIEVAEKLWENPAYRIEAAFFMAAGYAFKGRLLGERNEYRKAASAGKKALNYLEISKNNEELSPELVFGDGLFNYYAEWIPENYPIMKPILWFFPNGDKDLGLKQLRQVSRYAFYTRTEAQVFLMRLLNSEDNNSAEALQVSAYLAITFPDNSYLERYYANMLYQRRDYENAERVSLRILEKVDSGQVGYGPKTGKYVAFYLGQIYQSRQDREKTRHYYTRAMNFAAVGVDGLNSGYYLWSANSLAKLAALEGEIETYRFYYDLLKEHSKTKDKPWKDIKAFDKQFKEKSG